MNIEKTKEMPIYLKEAAKLIGYSPGYVYKLAERRQIPFRKPTGGRLHFLKSELIDFLNRNRSAANYEVSEKADDILNGANR